jgi:hypothetical protein
MAHLVAFFVPDSVESGKFRACLQTTMSIRNYHVEPLTLNLATARESIGRPVT